MAMSDLILGNSQGKTAWGHFKDRLKKKKAAEHREARLAAAFNPLGLVPGDLVEIGFLEKSTCKVQSLLWYRTQAGDPDYVRYGLKDVSEGDVTLLEAIPGDTESDFNYGLFHLMDEFGLDDQLLDVMVEENTLRHTVSEDGEQVELDYQKDFETEATVEIISAEDHNEIDVVGFNYFLERDGKDEEFLNIEIVESNEWMSFFRGKALKKSDLRAYGSLQRK